MSTLPLVVVIVDEPPKSTPKTLFPAVWLAPVNLMWPAPLDKLAPTMAMPCGLVALPIAAPDPSPADPPPSVMLPPKLVMPEPVFIRMAPAPLPSLSLLSTTLSLPSEDVMVVFDAITMSLWALSVSVASPPAVLAMLALTLMSPALAPPAPVAMVTLVPASRLAAMSDARMVESAVLE